VKEYHSSPYLYRQDQLSIALQTGDFSGLVLNPGASMRYLTGLEFHLMERPVTAIFIPRSPIIMVVPELETAKLEKLTYAVQVFTFGDDPGTWQQVFKQALRTAGWGYYEKIGIEPHRLRLLEFRLLEGASSGLQFVSAESVLSSLRMQKDEIELAAMRKAVEIAQLALHETLPLIKTGATEKEIAAELTLQLLRGGSEPEIPFSPIVSAGPNSANPHATPSHRPLQSGDCLVIDWGATYDGYISDITRTFSVAEADDEMMRVAQIVLQANKAGRDAAQPGISAGAIDNATRRVIQEAGYGNYFIHRTGHGIGLESHEQPYLFSGNEQVLTPGMTFTVEPGIYLPNRNGVRIEDNLVITEEGVECLTDLNRDLVVVG
jgi:Xaa-Pro dipeptidase